MAKEALQIGSLCYSLYQTGAGTWQGYIRWAGESWQVQRKTKADVVAACREHYNNVSGGVAVTRLTIEDARMRHEAMRILKPFNVSLVDAANHYVRTHSGMEKRITAAAACEEFLAQKKADKISSSYLHFLTVQLNKFSDAFGASALIDITPQALETWLRGMKKLEARGRNNYRSVLITLFLWARRQRYLPRDGAVAPEDTAKAKEKVAPITVISPKRFAALVRLAKKKAETRPHALTLLMIEGHTGIRLAELARLKWEAVNITVGHIAIGADIAKTASRRLVPINPTLSAWLSVEKEKAGGKGLIIPKMGVYEQMTELWPEKKRVDERGEEEIIRPGWPQNCLRHSFISYRLAEVEDVAKVALEAGNSAQKIFNNYRSIELPDGRLITKELAAKWFGVNSVRWQH